MPALFDWRPVTEVGVSAGPRRKYYSARPGDYAIATGSRGNTSSRLGYGGSASATIIRAWADAADLGEALAVAGRVPAGDNGMWQQERQEAATAAQSAADAAAARGAGTPAARGYLRSAEYHPGLFLPA